MAAAEAAPAQDGWSNLAKFWHNQKTITDQMVACTEAALTAIKEGALETALGALADRAKLMAESEQLEKQAGTLRRALGRTAAGPGGLLGAAPAFWKEELKAAYEGRLGALKRALALNTELVEALTGFKRKLQGDMEQLVKLRHTAFQYRPKDVTGEGRFIDSRG